MKEIDARGLACPEPLMLLQKALRYEDAVIVHTDCAATYENLRAYTEKADYKFLYRPGDDCDVLTVEK
ncbi:MAG: sulfurtransferase TusA family protein [Eubacteriales bacterium]|nr:sulfurtransferase TusA family protein [Eubacteriales bacterium]